MKKLGLLSVTGLTMLLGLVNVNTAKRTEAPKAQTLEVKDVLVKGATEGEGRVVRRAAAPATEYGMSDTFLQVTAPDAEGNVDVRFVAGIDSYAYTEAKFGVEMFAGTEYKGSIEKAVTTAYAAMEIDGEVKTASEVFGEGYNYLIAYTMKDMPKDSWGNGFRATVGLKAEGDEEFTEQETQEVKVVKSAIMADNHLLFTWRPWEDVTTNATLVWENEFFIDVVAPEIKLENFAEASEYNAAINAVIKEKMRAEITMKDGTVHHSATVAPHGVAAHSGKQVSVSVPNVNLRDELYSVKFIIDLPNGSQVIGNREYEQLSLATNAKIDTNENGDYVLTFDAPSGAETATYRLFNDSYSTVEKNVNSGDVIDVTTLPVGLYNLEITVDSQYYVGSTATFEGALNIETAITILDGNAAFEFELHHELTNYEHVFRFKPINAENAVTADNMIKDLIIVREDGSATNSKFVAKTLANGIGTSKAYPSYDETTGYYTFGFSINETPNTKGIYTMTFVVEADNGSLFSVELMFKANEKGAGLGTNEAYVLRNHGVQEFVYEYNNLNLLDTLYSEENWAAIQEIYDDTIETLETAAVEDITSIIANALESIKAVEMNISVTLLNIVGAEASSVKGSNTVEKAYDLKNGAANTGTFWQAVDGKKGVTTAEYTLTLEKLSSVSFMTITWGNRTSITYDIEVSTDGTAWTKVYTHTGSDASKRTDNVDLGGSYSALYIKISNILYASSYGASIAHIEVKGS